MKNPEKKHPVRDTWRMLSQPIYVGERLEAHLRMLFAISIVTIILSVVLIVANAATGQYAMLIASVITGVSGVACAYCARVLKKNNIASLIPNIFCGIMFTVYVFTGAGNGSAMLFSLLVPIGLCYFVSVKYGIVLSAYYCVLYSVIFYSPLKNSFSAYYTPEFMGRFPIVYISLSVFTGLAMAQYHRNALLEIDYARRLNEEVARQTAVAEDRSRKIEQMSFQTIQTLAHAIDAKDPYTKGHSSRVSQHSVMVAQALGWDQERINELQYAALLHDIGKIGVPDSILNKPTRLTDVEYAIIKSHTTMGGDILKDKTTIGIAEDVARSHHERYDGGGYPRGLKGEEISEEARIVAIADAFDAMNSNRVYRKACDAAHIRRELIEGKGKQFDPRFVDIFIGLWDQGLLSLASEADADAASDELEASSALLQQVMERFAAQNAADGIDLTTGILGRAAGEAAIAKVMQEKNGWFVLIDMDNLKKINDTSGHSAGDRALRLTGETLANNSENGLCCRLGGDEFILFLKDASRKEAEAGVQKLIAEFDRKKQADIEISVASLSAGVAMSTPAEAYTIIFNNADKALYHVKQNGKGGYYFYNSETEAEEKVDAGRLVSSIRTSGSYDGALDVEYRQFARLYEYITNLEHRFAHPFKLVLIELEAPGVEASQTEELERAMYFMEQSIRQTVRNVDVVTRYSRRQFLIILVGTDNEGVKIVIDRVFRGYYKMSGSGMFSPRYITISE